MRLRDIFNKITGSSQTAKGEQLELIGVSLTAIEEWIESNIGIAELHTYSNDNPEFHVALDRALQLFIRLERRITLTSSNELLDDWIVVAQNLFLFKYIIAYEHDFRFNSTYNMRLQFSELAKLADLDSSMLPLYLREAIESTDSLTLKYH